MFLKIQYFISNMLLFKKLFKTLELSSKNKDCKLLHWPQGSRVAKEDQKNAKLKERVLHVQAKAIANMVVVMMKKAKNLEVQGAFQLFIMLEKLITTLEVCEYLLLRRPEELKRLWCQMGTLHTSRDSTIVGTNNITIAPSTLHPHVESTDPLHATKLIKNNQRVKIVHAFDVSCNMHQSLGLYTNNMVDAIWNLD
jgi:hypothetical protein